jgi:ketosteroid isomerase-like protein
MLTKEEIEAEKALIEQKINDCIGWPFPEKNIDRFLNSIVQDSSLFVFHPDSKSTIDGFDAYKPMIDVFVSDDLNAIKTELSDLKINLSESGTVAWFSTMLDDMGEWKGEPYHWENSRWTGVLEKRAGEWVIVQMHFSLPSDQ